MSPLDRLKYYRFCSANREFYSAKRVNATFNNSLYLKHQ